MADELGPFTDKDVEAVAHSMDDIATLPELRILARQALAAIAVRLRETGRIVVAFPEGITEIRHTGGGDETSVMRDAAGERG